jgi:hypothetical protein
MNFCPKTGKVTHASANEAARQAVARGLKPYRCPCCAGWHVTHHKAEMQPQRKWARKAFGAASN